MRSAAIDHIGYGWKPIVAGGTKFDGSTYLNRGATLTGAADSKSGILSFWINATGTGSLLNLFVGLGVVTCQWLATNKIAVQANNATPVTILQINNSTALSAGTWYHFLASWDLSTTTTHVYINDVSDKTVTTATNDTIDYTTTNWSIGSDTGGGSNWVGNFAEFYFASGQYLDFSVASNRRKFITATLIPNSLGSDGSTPTGTAPIVYQSIVVGGTASGFVTNKGSGGNFSTAAGALTSSTTSASG